MKTFTNLFKYLILLVFACLLKVFSFAQLRFENVATYQASGGFDKSATEIVVYDSLTQHIYSTNSALNRIDVVNISNLSNPILIDSLAMDSIGGGINSVAVYPELGLVAAAVEADIKQNNGFVVFYSTQGELINIVEVGALPDMITFTHDGMYALVACEGEPNADYSNDPEGTVAVIEIPADITEIDQSDVTILNFNAFDSVKSELVAEGVHIFGGVTPFEVLNFMGANDDDADSIQISFEAHDANINLELISTIHTGAEFDEGGTEIIAYDKMNHTIYSTNAFHNTIDIIDIADIKNPVKIDSFELDTIGGGANSVAVWGNLVVAAVQADSKQDNGYAVFWNTAGEYITSIVCGALPDMVTFTPDGEYVLVANEGEPNGDYSIDPEGSVTIITIPDSIEDLDQSYARTADFNAFDAFKDSLVDLGLRINGGSEAYMVDTFYAANQDDEDTIVVDGNINIMPGSWITLDSDNSDDDADFVRTYQVAEVLSDSIVLSTEFDFDLKDSVTVEEGTNIFATAAMFTAYLLDRSATVSEDLEPEYIAVNATSDTAFVTLQENNGLAVVDIINGTIIDILPLGFKDHSLEGNGLDASNKDDSINIANHPIHCMYMPDAISTFQFGGETFYVTANEGDAREYDGLIEELAMGDLPLDSAAWSDMDIDSLQHKTVIGKLKTSVFDGDTDGDGDYDELFAYGARSFSVWDDHGNMLFDSGDDFEQITAEIYPDWFNSTNDEADFDDRSDNKGPEPEAITTGVVNGKTLVFIGLERMGGVMVYEVISPTQLEFIQYINNRDFDAASPEEEGDLAPEDIVFIPAMYSPNGQNLIAVSNEVSGTISFFSVVDEEMPVKPGSWMTIDSDNTDDDADFVRTYQVEKVLGDIIVFTSEFDYDMEDGEIVEGTDIDAEPALWTAFSLDGSATVSEDVEPEYIAVSKDNSTAIVTLQENNAMAIVDLEEMMISDIKSFGEKDHSLEGNGLDASNKDDEINIANYPVMGMYMPDAITSFEVDGVQFYATANEGDAREYDAMIEEFDVADLPLDTAAFLDADSLQLKSVLGKLDVTNMRGDIDKDGDYDVLYSYGSRSMTIWNENGDIVWDSGDDVEQITAALFPEYFNSDNDEAGELDARSDDKGPEPEAIESAMINDTVYLFLGLERMGGIMVYKVVDIEAPEFVTYINDRNYEGSDEEQGDLAPESIEFIEENAEGNAMIAVGHEVSGTIALYEINLDQDTTITQINEMLRDDISVYPVPAASSLTVEISDETFKTQTVQIIDVTGRLVQNIDLTSGTNEISIAGFKSGVYWIRSDAFKQVFTVK